MRKHTDYPKEYIGSAENGDLILYGTTAAGELSFSSHCIFGCGMQEAFIVDEEAEISDDFRLIESFSGSVTIIDDDGQLKNYTAERLLVYRTGEEETIIQLIGRKARGDNACCLCGGLMHSEGNSAWPVMTGEKDRCCDSCNLLRVVPARIRRKEQYARDIERLYPGWRV